MSENTAYESLREERLATCPIKPRCRQPDDDMLLRSIRSNRLLCHKCYVRTPTGYIGEEEARASDARFFKGNWRDVAIQAVIVALGTLVATTITLLLAGLGLGLGFFGLLIAFFIGSAAGTAIATFARRATGRRVARQSIIAGIGAVIIGALPAPSLVILLRGGPLIIDPELWVSIPLWLCAGVIGAAVYNSFMRRI